MSPLAVLLLAAATGLTAQHRLDPDAIAISRSAGLQPAGPDRLLGIGAGYRAWFTADGMRYEPALGAAVDEVQHLQLTPTAVRRGGEVAVALPSFAAPVADRRVATYRHAVGVHERYEVAPDGVLLSWRFDVRPAGSGDLVARYAVDTSLGAPTAGPDGGLRFALPDGNALVVGAVTGVDAGGRRCGGRVSWVGGALELALPAAFVDAASYPLVLDPLIGAEFQVTPQLYCDEPDAAFDASYGRWLVVYRQRITSNTYEIRAQRVNADGTLSGAAVALSSAGDVGRPRVANLGSRDRFGVVWREPSGNGASIEFRALSAIGGLPTHGLTVATTFSGDLLTPDIGADTDAPIGSNRGFVVVYEDQQLDAIRARRIHFSANDQLVGPPPTSVFTDTFGLAVYSQPAISRAGASAADLMVVARRFSGLTNSRGVSAALVESDTGAVGPVGSVFSSTTDDVTNLDVDGHAGRWIVAWQQNSSVTGLVSIVRQRVDLDAGATALVPGPSGSSTGFFGTQLRYPTVGYTPGRTWFGYRHVQSSQTTLRVLAIDTVGCSSCNETYIGTPFSTVDRIVVATGTSGGATDEERALAVWSDGLAIRGQRLQNHGTAGGFANLGGGCGSGGVVLFSHEPGIGSSGLECTVTGLPATALVSVFNFSAPATALACGPCQWTPFSVTTSVPVTAGGASVEFPIPCRSVLIGQQFETQWTTLDPAQTACAQFPGLVLSDRVLLTLGN